MRRSAEPARGSSEEWQADWHDARPFRPRLTARPVIRVARVPVLSHLSLDARVPVLLHFSLDANQLRITPFQQGDPCR